MTVMISRPVRFAGLGACCSSTLLAALALIASCKRNPETSGAAPLPDATRKPVVPMNHRHNTDPRDPQWAPVMEAKLRERYGPTVLARFGLERVQVRVEECRSTTCLVTFDWPQDVPLGQWSTPLEKMLSELPISGAVMPVRLQGADAPLAVGWTRQYVLFEVAGKDAPAASRKR
jgi:hypothetical protein